MTPDDEIDSWIHEARDGSPDAVDALIQHHLPAIRALVRLKAGPGILQRESAADVAQSICREILESLGSFREGGADDFRGWLHTIAIRKLHDRHRGLFAAKRDVRREVALDNTPSAWSEACDVFQTPSNVAIGREAQARLDAAFANLDEEQQNIVWWSRFLRLSHREIAMRIGKTETATRKSLSRALLRLAEAVDDDTFVA
ncbi:MAG: sigma-70 family RNA polymerase sigma factor [Planctomycetes bacterium]|nr:sigma-70 family RNA polymerase sigma factor [Planctomycetota bacterium]